MGTLRKATLKSNNELGSNTGSASGIEDPFLFEKAVSEYSPKLG